MPVRRDLALVVVSGLILRVVIGFYTPILTFPLSGGRDAPMLQLVRVAIPAPLGEAAGLTIFPPSHPLPRWGSTDRVSKIAPNNPGNAAQLDHKLIELLR